MDQEKRWFADVDWASQANQVRLTDASGSKVGERIFEHGGAGLRELATWILAAMVDVAKLVDRCGSEAQPAGRNSSL